MQQLGELIRAAPNITPQGGISFDFLLVTQADAAVFEGWAEDGVRCTAYRVAELDAASSAAVPVAPIVAAPALAPARQPDGAAPPATIVRVDLARLDDLMQMYPLNNPGRRRSQTAYEPAQRGSVTPVAPTF